MSIATFAVAESGLLAQGQKMAVIGNNIANSRSIGYKSNQMRFSEHLTTQKTQYSNSLRKQIGNGVNAIGTSVDWQDGTIEETVDAAHIAVVGKGFWPVSLGDETVYTRAGDFALVETAPGAGSYVLMRPNGAVLYGGTATGDDVSVDGAVTFDAPPESYSIASNGLISAVGATVTNGQIGLQRFANPNALERLSAGMFRATAGAAAMTATSVVPGTSGTGRIQQGALEQSNVELIKEFTDMIITQRSFQANSRSIITASEMLQEVINLRR